MSYRLLLETNFRRVTPRRVCLYFFAISPQTIALLSARPQFARRSLRCFTMHFPIFDIIIITIATIMAHVASGCLFAYAAQAQTQNTFMWKKKNRPICCYFSIWANEEIGRKPRHGNACHAIPCRAITMRHWHLFTVKYKMRAIVCILLGHFMILISQTTDTSDSKYKQTSNKWTYTTCNDEWMNKSKAIRTLASRYDIRYIQFFQCNRYARDLTRSYIQKAARKRE